MNGNYGRAEELAARNYAVVVFREYTSEGTDYIYVASNPAIDGCKAQGDSLEEAIENLAGVRIDMIEHLLDFNLPVPTPEWQSEPNDIIVEQFFQDVSHQHDGALSNELLEV